MLNELEKELLDRYHYVNENSIFPRWAENIPPSIPIVGNNYMNSRVKILCYMMSEYRAQGYERIKRYPLINELKEEQLWYRHRYFLEEYWKKRSTPLIHIEEVDNGNLLPLLKYIIMSITGDEVVFNSPLEVLENVAITHFSKFFPKISIKKGYHKTKNKIEPSLNFLKEDIKVLKPDYVLLPITIATLFGEDLFDRILKLLPQIDRDNISVVKLYMLKKQAIKCFVSKKKFKIKDSVIFDPMVQSAQLSNLDEYISWIYDKLDDIKIDINQKS